MKQPADSLRAPVDDDDNDNEWRLCSKTRRRPQPERKLPPGRPRPPPPPPSRDAATGNVPAITIDLHGYRRSAALRTVTDVLEQHQRNGTSVCIVTGTGRHSTDGPVLRQAVQTLLHKRHMVFYQDTPGSFVVNPQTGITLYDALTCTPVDTKVVLRSHDDDEFLRHRRSRQGVSRARSSPPGFPRANSTTSCPDFGGGEEPVMADSPRLQDVVRDERAVAAAKQASLASARFYQHTRRQDERTLQQALQRSQHDVKQDDDMLQRAILASQQQSEVEQRRRRAEEDDWMRVMLDELSNNHGISPTMLQPNYAKDVGNGTGIAFCHNDNDDGQSRLVPTLRAATDDDEEARLIQEAIALSLQ